MSDRSRLLSITVRNLGCIGPKGLTIELDKIVCLVGKNNAGNSTILRAYELAQGCKALAEHDRCQWTPEGQFPEVELSVHIPEGVENVDERWKIIEGNLRTVRSRWQWKSFGKPDRQTWNPEINGGIGYWDGDEKAGGADNVFNSRLPQPLRIDALKDSIAEHDTLMKLVLEPIAKDLELLKGAGGSALRQALDAVRESTKEPVAAYQEKINDIGAKVASGMIGVFPNLNINIKSASIHRRLSHLKLFSKDRASALSKEQLILVYVNKVPDRGGPCFGHSYRSAVKLPDKDRMRRIALHLFKS